VGRPQQEFVDEETSKAGRIVADQAVFFQEIVEHKLDLALEYFFGVNDHGLGALGAIAACNIRGDGLAIGNNPVDDAIVHMELNGAQMLTQRVVSGFAGLGHEIGDIDARRFGAGNGLGNFRNEEIGNHAGVKRAGTHEDEVGFLNGVNGFGKGANAARHELDLPDGRAAAGDFRLAADVLAIGERRGEMHVGDGGGEDAAADREDLAGDVDGFGKIAGDVGEGGKEQVTEIMADEPAPRVKTVLEKPPEESFIFR